MDIFVPSPLFRDRRPAAADQFMDGSEIAAPLSCESDPDARPCRAPRHIFARGTAARRAGEALRGTPAASSFDVRSRPVSRDPRRIHTIVLHLTDGRCFRSTDLPDRGSDLDIASHHRVDEIIAHFIVLGDGAILYTRDVEYSLNDAGASRGIDIEFAGRRGDRTTLAALNAGLLLVRQLKLAIPSITHIHPHGQVQRGSSSKLHSCPGPDVWVNVGELAAREHGFATDTTAPGYENHGISSRQRDSSYVRPDWWRTVAPYIEGPIHESFWRPQLAPAGWFDGGVDTSGTE